MPDVETARPASAYCTGLDYRCRILLSWPHPGPLATLVSAVASALIALHILSPSSHVDGVTVALVAVLILPWVGSFVKNLEVSATGAKIQYHDLQRAGLQVTAPLADDQAPPPPEQREETPTCLQVRSADANLALVGLRIEIEKRINELAQLAHIPFARRVTSLNALVRELQSRGILTGSQATGLRDLVAAGNAAAHGAVVDDNVTFWALDVGPDILAALDSLLATLRFEGQVTSALEGILPAGAELVAESRPDTPDATVAVGTKRYAVEIKRALQPTTITSSVEQAKRWLGKGFDGALIISEIGVDEGVIWTPPGIPTVRVVTWRPDEPVDSLRTAIDALQSQSRPPEKRQ